MMKIGDKVRFLNDVGGGVISGFQGKDTVLVQDEDGFDLPILKSECIVVQTDNYNKELSPQEVQKQDAMVDTNIEDALDTPVLETKEGEYLNVFLAFVPQDIKSISTTSFDVFLVNDSNYFLYYTYSNEVHVDEYSNRSHDLIAPNTKLYIETFTKDVLNELDRIRVQLIAFKHDRNYVAKAPVDTELRIDTVKFYKLHSFKESVFFDEPALIYEVVINDNVTKKVKIDADLLKEILFTKTTSKPKSEPIVKRAAKKGDVVEVDLHIHELLDDTKGMDNKSILDYQLKVFHETMNKYIHLKKQRIVFIHGKGEGILRKSIIDELKSKYKKCTYQDASFQEYGFGATMITIR